MMMQEGRDFSHEADDVLEPLSPENDEEQKQQQQQPTTKKRKSNKNNKRRFSDQQVRSLETIFESETKLEPRKKVQVARELGLQPRQVAIWFQNKRARWKSKEIEKNYRVLKSNYDCLKARLEAVRKDKESLLTQLQELRSVLERSRDSTEDMAKSSRVQQEDMERQGLLVYSDDDRSGNMEYLKQEEAELMNVDGSIVSPVKWCSFDAGSLFDQSSTSSHWWESWT